MPPKHASHSPPRFVHPAAKEAISINQFITIAVAEKMSALLTEDYLTERAQRADPAVVDRMLARVPEVPPVPGDELEPDAAYERPNRQSRRSG